ncbi:hypothetical protein [Streptomyces sudanensis]|uniref:hypothetical protein n=1 Tax=Streptomyces sudanensis TaxID=436397 RepID=UPI0020CF4E08|nr:hypothetical protein [Streptomyces sudanensis]MCP9956250.1 hypothetical protein [Streptomyces sudanensis]
MRERRLDQGGAVADRRHHLVAVLGEQADQALAQQYRVVGDDDPQRAPARGGRPRSGGRLGVVAPGVSRTAAPR